MIKAILEGGQVQRFHTKRTHRPYTVAEHSWRMAMLLRHLLPGAPPRLIWAVLSHDIAERWVGDVPATVKWYSPDLKLAMAQVEEHVEKRLGIAYDLPMDEAAWLHAIDLLDLYLFCVEERMLGNSTLEQVERTCATRLTTREWVPEPVRKFVRETVWTIPVSDFLEDL